MHSVPLFFRRIHFIALIAALTAVAGFIAPRAAWAQARPALTRDTDNADLAPVTFNVQVPYSVSTDSVKVTTVVAGKRLVVDTVSYFCTAFYNSGCAYLALSVVTQDVSRTNPARLIFPLAAPFTTSSNFTQQAGAFSGSAYFEAGETVYLNYVAGTNGAISAVITGHYVTP